MPNDRSILLIEDDDKLAQLVREYLETHGRFSVSVEPRGDAAVDRILVEQPDLVILDLMLPGLDGLLVCREVRPRYDGPILMLTARGEEVDEVVGLELGADDYIAKPVRPRVLLARLNTLLRRARGAAGKKVVVGALEVDAASRLVRVAGERVLLTTAEFDLLWFLAERRGEPVTRDVIFKELRGVDYDGLDRSMDLRISRLRDKLGAAGKLIKSVRGVGYVMAVEP